MEPKLPTHYIHEVPMKPFGRSRTQRLRWQYHPLSASGSMLPLAIFLEDSRSLFSPLALLPAHGPSPITPENSTDDVVPGYSDRGR